MKLSEGFEVKRTPVRSKKNSRRFFWNVLSPLRFREIGPSGMGFMALVA
jgi:hypothetical protein